MPSLLLESPPNATFVLSDGHVAFHRWRKPCSISIAALLKSLSLAPFRLWAQSISLADTKLFSLILASGLILEYLTTHSRLPTIFERVAVHSRAPRDGSVLVQFLAAGSAPARRLGLQLSDNVATTPVRAITVVKGLFSTITPLGLSNAVSAPMKAVMLSTNHVGFDEISVAAV